MEYETYTFKKPYKNIDDTLYWLVEQAKSGIPYAEENLPHYNSPEQLFEAFKSMTTYKSDPKGVELIQSLPTMMEDNFHGITGAGDCDCFVTALLSIIWANDLGNPYIVLTSRNKSFPQHIYLYLDHNGKRYVMDATNPYIGMERPYPYRQIIKAF